MTYTKVGKRWRWWCRLRGHWRSMGFSKGREHSVIIIDDVSFCEFCGTEIQYPNVEF